MKLPRAIHSWRVSPTEAIAIQRELAGRVAVKPLPRDVRWIAGADMAFSPDGQRCVAGVVLWDRLDRAAAEEQVAVRSVRFPYVPGLLSFREAPAVLAALAKLRRAPDVIMLDGQGVAHPRRCGLASHIGLCSGLPTVGCAKSRLCGEHEEPKVEQGCHTPLRDGNEVIGAVVRTRANVRPVFVSVGHLATLEDGIRLVLSCCTRYRLPEPTRLAHQLVTRERTHVGVAVP